MNLEPSSIDEDIRGIEVPPLFRTTAGRLIDFNNIIESDLDIESAANGLATVQRWGGQATSRVTVAEHSLAVCSILPDQYKFDGLMHDISEGILGIDAAKPIKNLLPDFQALENKIMRLASKKWGFRYPLPAIVKEADIKVTKFEWKHCILRSRSPEQIPSDEFLKEEFLRTYYELIFK